MLARRSPVGQSESALVSRDHSPRTGGPELIASWPLGHPPADRGTDGEWRVDDETLVLQRNVLSLPYAGPLDYSRTYLNACGRARPEGADEQLVLGLHNVNLDGKPYETEIALTGDGDELFLTPMVEFTPDSDEYTHAGRIFGEYELRARTTAGAGYVDHGTSVQFWGE